MDRPKFFYVTYPLPIEMAEAFPVPPAGDEKKTAVPLAEDKDFEALWYYNSKFPEDE